MTLFDGAKYSNCGEAPKFKGIRTRLEGIWKMIMK